MIETSGPIRYHRLRSGGYALIDKWWCMTGIVDRSARVEGQVSLDEVGRLVISPGWPWDGPSGPTVDTPSFMRGSLAHDALYEILRAGKLEPQIRKAADKLLYDLCRQDGMGIVRANWVYAGVRFGAGYAAKPHREPELEPLIAP